MQCTLCNEHIADNELAFGEAIEVEGEYWHSDCYEEYHGELLEVV